jgi:hypothetical protein
MARFQGVNAPIVESPGLFDNTPMRDSSYARMNNGR